MSQGWVEGATNARSRGPRRHGLETLGDCHVGQVLQRDRLLSILTNAAKWLLGCLSCRLTVWIELSRSAAWSLVVA